jgi:hypothetical protein
MSATTTAATVTGIGRTAISVVASVVLELLRGKRPHTGVDSAGGGGRRSRLAIGALRPAARSIQEIERLVRSCRRYSLLPVLATGCEKTLRSVANQLFLSSSSSSQQQLLGVWILELRESGWPDVWLAAAC